ncbi:MAG TPA: hypothetical protein DER10_04040 [Elusimicrobia bacterium]|nr:hypothetical protein [Elusimicrobiota bacterium]HCE97649.1 hypothetical protein [Elusimicrobiota bacterium]
MRTYNSKRGLKIATAALMTVLVIAAGRSSFAQFSEITPLPQGLLAHSAVVINNMVYVAGGVGDTGGVLGKGGFLNDVYYCAGINADGTLGEWKVASSMPEVLGLGMHASVAYDSQIYVLGGTNMFGARNRVYRSAINADGALAGWVVSTPLPNAGLMAHDAVIAGGRIYALGGIVRLGAAVADVYYADILPDKSLGEWKKTVSLPVNLFGHKALAANGRIYVMGGTVNGTLYVSGAPNPNVSSAVYSARILADGSLAPWETTAPLPEAAAFHAVSFSGKNIYVLGGFNGTGVSNAVYYAPVLPDGALGAWQALYALPKNLLALASAANDTYLYSIGGALTYIDEPQSNIYFAMIKAQPKAFVRINPATLNKKSNGKYVTAIVGLPEADVNLILPNTVRISAINGVPIAPIYVDPKWATKFHTGDCDEFSGLTGINYAMFKFDRQALQNAAPEGEVTIKLEGTLLDARTFSGENTNWVIKPGAAKINTARERAGFRRSHSGAGADIGQGAFPGNPDLLLTVENEDEAAVGGEEKEKRENARKHKSLVSVSSAVEFGPHGMQFEKPVTIAIPYNPAAVPAGAKEDDLIICYWNAEAAGWEGLPSSVSKEEKLVRAKTAHFSVYQVMAGASPTAEAPIEQAFSLGEAYVFPNPAVAGAAPKLHISATAGDSLAVKVYSVSGRLAYETSFTGRQVEGAYELELRGEFPSGVYYYSAEVTSGAQKIRKNGKFAVVR